MSLGAQQTVTSRIGERLKGRACTRPRCPLSLFLPAYTHAILLIVSGSFVLETSSSCDLVVPMRALPRPMGRYSVPLVFAVNVNVVVILIVCPPLSCSDVAHVRKKRNARRFRSDDTIEKMLPLLCALLSSDPGSTPPSFVVHAEVMQTALLESYSTLVS